MSKSPPNRYARILCIVLAVVFAVSLAATTTGVVQAKDFAANVNPAKGLTQVEAKGTTTWTPLSDVTMVKVGDTVQTGANSAATLTIVSGITYALGQNTTIQLTALSSDDKSGALTATVSQLTGTVTFSIAQNIKKGDSVSLVTPTETYLADSTQPTTGLQLFVTVVLPADGDVTAHPATTNAMNGTVPLTIITNTPANAFENLALIAYMPGDSRSAFMPAAANPAKKLAKNAFKAGDLVVDAGAGINNLTTAQQAALAAALASFVKADPNGQVAKAIQQSLGLTSAQMAQLAAGTLPAADLSAAVSKVDLAGLSASISSAVIAEAKNPPGIDKCTTNCPAGTKFPISQAALDNITKLVNAIVVADATAAQNALTTPPTGSALGS